MPHAVRYLKSNLFKRVYTVKVVFISFGNEIDKWAFHPLISFIRLNNILETFRMKNFEQKMSEHHRLWNIILPLISIQKWQDSIFARNYIMQSVLLSTDSDRFRVMQRNETFLSVLWIIIFHLAFDRRLINSYTIKIDTKIIIIGNNYEFFVCLAKINASLKLIILIEAYYINLLNVC